MKAGDILNEIESLALSERIILVEDIWDGLAKHNFELPMPECQKKELDR